MRAKFLAGLLVLSLLACTDAAPGPIASPGIPATIMLTRLPADVMRSRGDTQTVHAVVRDSQHAIIDTPVLSWASSAPSVATVSGSGANAIIVAVGDGTATISAASGSVQSSVSVTVRRTLATVHLSAPDTALVYGSSMPLAARAQDARGHVIDGVDGFTFATNNLASTSVSADGIVTALFQVPQIRDATLSATLTRDGVTATGTVAISVGGPVAFDRAAVMLSDFVWPVRVPNTAAGVAFFTRKGPAFDYRVTWSAMSTPAVQVQVRGPASETEIGNVLVEFPLPLQMQTFGVVLGSLSAADIQPQNGRAPISIDSLAVLLCNRKAYVEVRSAAFPLGEMRGQVQCAP